jgi:hypothetical protein
VQHWPVLAQKCLNSQLTHAPLKQPLFAPGAIQDRPQRPQFNGSESRFAQKNPPPIARQIEVAIEASQNIERSMQVGGLDTTLQSWPLEQLAPQAPQ